jgi:hypothetical protein
MIMRNSGVEMWSLAEIQTRCYLDVSACEPDDCWVDVKTLGGYIKGSNPDSISMSSEVTFECLPTARGAITIMHFFLQAVV